MLTKTQLQELCSGKALFLDGATGSNLQKAGMPKGCCTEEWILSNPEALVQLQRSYAESGSRIVYAPTFQAQPIALERVNLHRQTEAVNAHLAALSRSAAPGCLVAGDITTLAAYCESWDPDNYGTMVENYRRQIRGLVDGGVDLLIGETLLYAQEADAIWEAAQLEQVETVMFTFTMQPDGCLFSGQDAAPVLHSLEQKGAAAVGFNCVAAGDTLPGLVSRLRRSIKGPLICKPNAGIPVASEDGSTVYPMGKEAFSAILADCYRMGAAILGGCCGTDPGYIAAVKAAVEKI